MYNSRERGLAEVVDLLCKSMEVEIDQLEKKNSQLEEEKAQSILEKIPECPVITQLHAQRNTNVSDGLFLRFVWNSSRRTGPSSAVWPDITSVEPARLRRPSR